MPNFTPDEMLSELRMVFLFEADHIRLGAGDAAAERFIGFGLEGAAEYPDHDPALVDLGRFEIPGAFESGFEYAFRPSFLNTFQEHEAQDLNEFMRGTPRASASGETHRFMTPEGLCQTVADAAFARWKLDDGHGPFTTRELALLANMTEGAVRNALADRSESGLRAIPGSKNPVEIEYPEAQRWLQGRRGFIATPERPLDDRFLRERLRAIETAAALGQLVTRRIWSALKSPDEAAKALGWTSERVGEWMEGRQAFDEVEAVLLAHRLGFDEPDFLGKTLEVTRRRDAAVAHGNAA